MSDHFEDPDFKSAFDKFSSENGGEFNLRHRSTVDLWYNIAQIYGRSMV
jgi:hypothetical protein